MKILVRGKGIQLRVVIRKSIKGEYNGVPYLLES